MTAVDFGRELLGNLDIHYHADPADLERLPASGPVLVVANHPFGLLEGPILLDLLEKIRPDYRIIANGLLSKFPPLRERVIFIDPFEETGSTHANEELCVPRSNGCLLAACWSCSLPVKWLTSTVMNVPSLIRPGIVLPRAWPVRSVARLCRSFLTERTAIVSRWSAPSIRACALSTSSMSC